jgi:hypothetical protein
LFLAVINNDPNAPAFPQYAVNEECEFLPGLTIRAELAARMMQGFIASPVETGRTPAGLAKHSIAMADALITELNRPLA